MDSHWRSCRNSMPSHRKEGGGLRYWKRANSIARKGGEGRRRRQMVTTIWCMVDYPRIFFLVPDVRYGYILQCAATNLEETPQKWELQSLCFEEFCCWGWGNTLGLVPSSLAYNVGYASTLYTPLPSPRDWLSGENQGKRQNKSGKHSRKVIVKTWGTYFADLPFFFL